MWPLCVGRSVGVWQTLISPEELRQLETDLATLISRDGPTIQALLHKRATEEPQGWLSQWFVAMFSHNSLCHAHRLCEKTPSTSPPHTLTSFFSECAVCSPVRIPSTAAATTNIALL